MRIVKVKQDGMSGAVVLNGSHLELRPAYCDEYCITFDVEGFDSKMDSQTYRLTLTRGELGALQRFADLAKKEG